MHPIIFWLRSICPCFSLPPSYPFPILMNRSLLLTAILCMGTYHSALAEDWRQWRGPHRDGHIGEEARWPGTLDSLKQVWHVELQPSYSGPLVIGNTIITTSSRDKSFEGVKALDRATGKEKWSVEWEAYQKVPFFAASNGDWIRATPVSDGSHVYVAGMRDVLVCLELATGKEVWRVDFVKELKADPPTFGFVCSPLLEGNFIYVQAGGAFCKLRKDTGELVWKSLADGGGMNGSAFSSPILTELGGVQQLVVQTRSKLCGVNPQDGAELWGQKIKTFQGMNILTPVVSANRIYTSAYGGKSQLFQLSKAENQLVVAEQWQHKAEAYMSTPVVIAGKIFLHLRNQRFTCLDMATGQQHWVTEEKFGKYMSLVANGDNILALDERGILLLIKANPEKFELLSQHKISEQETWAHLAISGRELFIRELKGLTAWKWE